MSSSLESILAQLDAAVMEKRNQEGKQETAVAKVLPEIEEQRAREASSALKRFVEASASTVQASGSDAKLDGKLSSSSLASHKALEQFIGIPFESNQTIGTSNDRVLSSGSKETLSPVDNSNTSGQSARELLASVIDSANAKTSSLTAPATNGSKSSSNEVCPKCRNEQASPQPQMEQIVATHSVSPPSDALSAIPALLEPPLPEGQFAWKQHLAEAETAIKKDEVKSAEAILRVLHSVAQVIAVEIPVRMRLVTQLANIRMEQGNIDEASELLAHMLTLVDKTEYENSIATAYCLDEFAQCLRLQEKLDQAEDVYCRAVKIAEQSLGAEHPGTAFFRQRQELFRQERSDLAHSAPSRESGQSTESTQPAQSTHAAQPQVIPLTQPKQSISTPSEQLSDSDEGVVVPEQITGTGDIPQLGRKPRKVPTAFDRIVERAQSRPIPLNTALDEVASSLYDKFVSDAENFLRAGNVSEAEISLRSAVENSSGLPDKDDRKWEGYHLMAMVLTKRGKLAEAGQLYENALTIAFRSRGADIHVGNLLKSIAELQARLANKDLAESYYQHAIQVYSNVFGDEHAETRALRKIHQDFFNSI